MPQWIVHITAVTTLTCPAGTFCYFCWPLSTAFPPVWMCHFIPKELWKSPTLIYPSRNETDTISNLPVIGVSIDKAYFSGPPVLNCVITQRMEPCGGKRKCTPAVSSNPKITLVELTYIPRPRLGASLSVLLPGARF